LTANGSVQHGSSTTGGALGYLELRLAADERFSLDRTTFLLRSTEVLNMNAPGSDAPNPAPVNVSGVPALVKALTPWKELIAVLIFFGAGVVWVASYFATRKQLDALECFARESVTLARAETSLRGTFDELIQRSVRIDSIEAHIRSGSATEADRIDSKRIHREVKDLEKRRDAASSKLEAAQKALDDGLCSKERVK